MQLKAIEHGASHLHHAPIHSWQKQRFRSWLQTPSRKMVGRQAGHLTEGQLEARNFPLPPSLRDCQIEYSRHLHTRRLLQPFTMQ